MSMFRSYRDTERTPSKINKKQHTTTSYYCDICDQGDWTSETEVEIHRKTSHLQHIYSLIKDKKNFACRNCAKDHPDNESLYQHIKSIHLLSSKNAERIEREIFICDHCCRLFFNKALLEVHMVRKHHRSVAANWKIDCPKCFKTLKKTCIWGHLEYHHISSVSTCPICLDKCASRTDLRNHLQKHRKYYHCGVCEFSTKMEGTYNQHLRSHRKRRSKDTNLNKYFVPTFKTSVVANYSVPSVMKGFMLANNIHICIICRHISVSESDMNEHLTYDHTALEEEKKNIYMCVCGEVFFHKILFKQHVFKEKDGHRIMDEAEVDAAVATPQLRPGSSPDPNEEPLNAMET